MKYMLNPKWLILASLAIIAIAAIAGHPLVSPELFAGLGALPMMVGDTTVDPLEIKKLVEAQGTAWEEFKKANDAKLEAKADGKTVGDFDAKLIKIATDMAEIKTSLTSIETKANRPQLGSDGKPIDENVAEHKKAFNGYMRKGTDFDRAIEVKALNIGAGGDGGYAVPKEIDTAIDAIAVNISPIRQIAKVVQVGTSDYHKLINTRGTSSGWVGETTARPETNTPTLVDVAPPMGELYANPQATQQMLDDVFFNAESWLAGEVGTEFARAEGAGFVNGTGVVQPRGFLTYTNVATGDASRPFGQIEFVGTGVSGAFPTLTSTVNPVDTLYSVVGKIKKAYRPGSQWLMNKGVLFTVMAFKDYQGRYVFSPTTAPGMSDTILGYPVQEAEDMPDMAANSFSVAFGNFMLGYLIVDRIGTRVIRDPFSNKPYIGFYTTKRVGGAVTNSEAIKLIKFI
jgi:HK97 family phage major capsid protein